MSVVTEINEEFPRPILAMETKEKFFCHDPLKRHSVITNYGSGAKLESITLVPGRDDAGVYSHKAYHINQPLHLIRSVEFLVASPDDIHSSREQKDMFESILSEILTGVRPQQEHLLRRQASALGYDIAPKISEKHNVLATNNIIRLCQSDSTQFAEIIQKIEASQHKHLLGFIALI